MPPRALLAVAVVACCRPRGARACTDVELVPEQGAPLRFRQAGWDSA
eukprot:gene13305-53576_t